MKIYTRAGDAGRSSLFGGEKVSKSDLRLEAYGTIDELNAVLGGCRCRSTHADLSELMESIQSTLFDLGAHLATPKEAVKARQTLPPLGGDLVSDLELAIDRLDTELAPLSAFVLPGGTPEAAGLHIARTVCRRAERRVVAVTDPTLAEDAVCLAYMNRLSDLFFVMARVVNRRAGVAEPAWRPRRGA